MQPTAHVVYAGPTRVCGGVGGVGALMMPELTLSAHTNCVGAAVGVRVLVGRPAGDAGDRVGVLGCVGVCFGL